MGFDVRDYFGKEADDFTDREITWLERLQSVLSDAEGELSVEAATHVILLVALRQIQGLEPLVRAGWRGDDPGSAHLDAIRRLASGIALVGQTIPLSSPEEVESHDETTDGDPE